MTDLRRSADSLVRCVWRGVTRKVQEMPADSLTVAVTTGLGFSVLAGIVTGVCYILSYGLPTRRQKRPLTPWQCSVCGSHFRSIDGILEVEKVATCMKCGAKVCKVKCATRHPRDGWTCQDCRSERWFTSILNVLQPSGKKEAWKLDASNMDQKPGVDLVDEDLLELQKREREQVRDFIERLVATLLGGDLDTVSVKKLYNDDKYDTIFARYHDDISNTITDLGSALHISIANLPILGQSPCNAHTTLKLLIQKFIQEANALPKLQKFQEPTAAADDTSDRTYEDLLSTAIINKVIQSNQDGGPSRRLSGNKRSDKEYFLGERNLDHRRHADDTSSLSSLDSESVPYKVRNKQPSTSGDETKDEDDIDSANKPLDWQDNWRLQKRKYNGTSSPVPVPMLVPDPITEAKVLIGDREADDTTDLSDAASEFDDAEEEALEPATLNAVLVNSRTVIGGRNPLESIVSKAESISEDGSTDNADLIEEKDDIVKKINGSGSESPIVETTNSPLIEDKAALDDMSLDSNTEKDSEYTERYASLPRTIYKYPKSASNNLKIDELDKSDKEIENDMKTDNVDSGVTSDEDEKQRFKGTYSEREKEKWNHAVPLDNNPYSKSNLERRLSNRSSTSSIGSGFGRDYYVKEASKATGARKGAQPTSEGDEISVEPDREEERPKLVWDPNIFKAVPVVVKEEKPSLPDPATRPSLLEISSDSDFSMERTYNIESGEVSKKPSQNDLLDSPLSPVTPESPKGLKYTKKPFDVDENQNTLQRRKQKFMRSLTSEEDSDLEEDVSSSLSFEEMRPPLENHFKIVEEIANETSDQYETIPISPPAQYKTVEEPFKPEISLTSNEESAIESNEEADKEIPTGQLIDFGESIEEPDTNNNNKESTEQIEINNHNEESKEDFSLTFSEISEPITEVKELKEETVPRKKLGAFSSKSEPNLQVPHEDSHLSVSSDNISIEENGKEDDEFPIVKRLLKMFDNNTLSKKEPVSSLTARSIPKQVREDLQRSTPTLLEDSREIVSSEPFNDTKQLPFPKAKSRIAFFEQLQQQK